MARWQNHYELALRNALESRGGLLMPIDEGAQATPSGRTIKNFDFVLWRDHGQHWLVEVKGRRLGKSLTPNAWATLEDVSSLEAWRELMGSDYVPVLAFVFDVTAGCERAAGDGFVSGAVGHDQIADHEPTFAMPWSSFGGAFGSELSGGCDPGDDWASSDQDQAALKPSGANKVHFTFGGRAYQAWMIRLETFSAMARLRSERWRTRMLSVASFRAYARPLLTEFLGAGVGAKTGRNTEPALIRSARSPSA